MELDTLLYGLIQTGNGGYAHHVEEDGLHIFCALHLKLRCADLAACSSIVYKEQPLLNRDCAD